MKAFADLVQRLALTPQRDHKLRILQRYLETTPDPDRGWALAALCGTLALPRVTPGLLREMAALRCDARLFALSHDFVRDLAETVALIWPDGTPAAPSLTEVVTTLQATGKAALPGVVAAMLDRLPPPARLAFLKLATGNLRPALPLPMVHAALAASGARTLPEIAEAWHGQTAPYTALFRWLAGAPRPGNATPARFRPLMAAVPVEPGALRGLDPADYVAEWQWDGLRVQAVCEGGVRRLYARDGQDISAAFPDIIAAMDFDGALDGELLVRRGTTVAPFADLQKRLGRKTASKALLASHPAALRVHDLLAWQGRDLRDQPLHARRALLEQAGLEQAGLDGGLIDLSPWLAFATWDDLAALRAAPPARISRGVMLKHRDGLYDAHGAWLSWPQDPRMVDAVLLYAELAQGQRAGFTFGLWDGDALVPVGKAALDLTDEAHRDEAQQLDRFIRDNTTERFGAVRALAPKLVVEVAFQGLDRAARRRSGLALRAARIARIHWDRPAAGADRLATLEAML